jgi:ubiquinone/menaquinone biosynthesis C-methylase UbiE
MRDLLISFLNYFPALKRAIRGIRKRFFHVASVSSQYVNLQGKEADAEGIRLRNSWQDQALPQKQRKLVDRQLQQFRAGAHIDVFDVFVNSLQDLPNIAEGMSLLEIGSSSGFYAEVLDIAQLPLKYSGCDYSKAFIQLAREKYPNLDFQVEDATGLSYSDCSFDIVVSGCCLLHIPEYIEAIKETARVAISYCIFHRTPVVWGQPEQWYRKQAYGCETIEIHFNEADFLDVLEGVGLEILSTHTLHEEVLDVDGIQGHAVRTYVCKKKIK